MNHQHIAPGACEAPGAGVSRFSSKLTTTIAASPAALSQPILSGAQEAWDPYLSTSRTARVSRREATSLTEAFLSRLSHRRKAHVMFTENLIEFVRIIGIARFGVVTLTFRNVVTKREADKRFAKLARTVLRPYFGPYVRVAELQARGAWHYHLLIDCLADIKTGYCFDWDDDGSPDHANLALCRLRHNLASGLRNCGFGHVFQLEPPNSFWRPVRYLAQKTGAPGIPGRRVRIVTYSRDFPRSWYPGFSLFTDGAFRWRQYVARRAAELDCSDLVELKLTLGPRWAFKLRRDLSRDRTFWWKLPGAPKGLLHLLDR